MDGLREYQREWSESEREKQISYINTYMWNLEKWHRSSYLQSKSRDIDIGNKWMDIKGKMGLWIGRLGLTHR